MSYNNQLQVQVRDKQELANIGEAIKGEFVQITSNFFNGDEARSENWFKSEMVHLRNQFFATGDKQAQDKAEKLRACTPDSIQTSLVDLTSLGLSLNPSKRQCYLIPWGNACQLSVSYLGIKQMAIEAGLIKDVEAVVVYAHEKIKIQEVDGRTKVQHIRDPFAFGKELKGVYTKATHLNGSITYDFMSKEDIDYIKSKSKSMKNENSAKYSPWTNFYEEMAKKTVIRRHAKSWVSERDNERFHKVVDYVNKTEGIDLNQKQIPEKTVKIQSQVSNVYDEIDEIDAIRDAQDRRYDIDLLLGEINKCSSMEELKQTDKTDNAISFKTNASKEEKQTVKLAYAKKKSELGDAQ